MNKLYFKIIFAFLGIFLCVYNVRVYAYDYTYKNDETNYEIIIEDDAELLNDSEEDSLASIMSEITKYGNVIFKSISKNPKGMTSSFAEEYYHSIFEGKSGTLFLIDMDNRNIYIFSDGLVYKTITNSKANIITDNVYRYASKGDYFNCAYKAFEQINALLKGEKINEPMRYISNILVSIITACFISFFIVLANSKIKKANVKEVITNCDVDFNIKNVRGTKVGEHRVYSPVDSGSSGGGSSGGGGGGSSGGGGGHSF